MTTTMNPRPSRGGAHRAQPSRAAKGPQGAQSRFRSILAPVVLVIIGLSIILYPVVSTYWNNWQQSVRANAYSELATSAPADVMKEQLDRALEYNAHLKSGPILDPWLARVTKDNEQYQEYLRQLDKFDAMGRVIIPAAKVDLPIYHGTEDATLQKGVGHLFGSHLPVGGDGTRTILTGHTGIPNATLFDNVIDLKKGDAIFIESAGEKLKYEVSDIKVVLPEESRGLDAVPGQDLVTLITCTPYGINSHRLLVTAHRVPLDPEDQAVFDDGLGITVQWWMWAILAATVLTLAALAWWVWDMLRRSKRAAAADSAAADSATDTAAVVEGDK